MILHPPHQPLCQSRALWVLVESELPLEQKSQAISGIDKMLDLCLLAETTAYIENTISCDMEVMREVADRVRNPAMIIGWNLKKLQG